jgi:hypothetical protein
MDLSPCLPQDFMGPPASAFLSSRLAILLNRMTTFGSDERFELVDTGQRSLE